MGSVGDFAEYMRNYARSRGPLALLEGSVEGSSKALDWLPEGGNQKEPRARQHQALLPQEQCLIQHNYAQARTADHAAVWTAVIDSKVAEV